jgi:hypothetical protein
MPLMNLFEPLFLLLAAATIASLATAAALAIRGRIGRAGRILRRVGVGAGLYFVVVIGVSAFSPPREFHVGDLRCFDDWCITVTGARRHDTPQGSSYDVSLRLSNRAKRVPMGEKGTVVYLVDAAGHRYDPEPDAAAVPLDTQIQPGESAMATRRFLVPPGAGPVGLVYTHEGGFPMGWLIISEDGWFKRPSVVRLD